MPARTADLSTEYAIMSLASQPCSVAGPGANETGDDVDKRSSKCSIDVCLSMINTTIFEYISDLVHFVADSYAQTAHLPGRTCDFSWLDILLWA